MKTFILTLFTVIFLPPSSQAESFPRAASGIEAGVATLSHQGRGLIATSWVYHFEYHPDAYLGFFGQAGQTQGEQGSRKYQQTQFSGGIKLPLLEVLSVDLGLSNTVNKVNTSSENKKTTEIGPLVRISVHSELKAFSLGTSVTLIRTGTLTSTALRAGLFILF